MHISLQVWFTPHFPQPTCCNYYRINNILSLNVVFRQHVSPVWEHPICFLIMWESMLTQLFHPKPLYASTQQAHCDFGAVLQELADQWPWWRMSLLPLRHLPRVQLVIWLMEMSYRGSVSCLRDLCTSSLAPTPHIWIPSALSRSYEKSIYN